MAKTIRWGVIIIRYSFFNAPATDSPRMVKIIYKLTPTGGIITQFPSPNLQPWDICKENEYLWVVNKSTIRAFRLNSMEYLLKPVSQDELKMAIERVMKTEIKHFSLQLQALKENVRE